MSKRQARTAALRSAVADALAYELELGIHTYHDCPCGREKTRAGKCWRCALEELTLLAEK